MTLWVTVMTLLKVLAIVAGLGFLIGVPAVLIWSMVDFTRRRASERPGSGSFTAGVAGAMQELDRLMARPSVEHTEEAQNPVLKREDDAGGG
ncbi:MAG TPA: hypothetical protein VF175_03405 [Lacipirellula sp.]